MLPCFPKPPMTANQPQAHQVCLYRAGRRARSLCTVLLFRKTSGLSTAALAGARR